MSGSKVEETLKELGVVFADAPPAPVASYVSYVRTGLRFFSFLFYFSFCFFISPHFLLLFS